jgi:hypothetical protein
MSKNTANIARAISLLSDVLSREAVTETEATETDPFDDSQASEFDELKHQSLEFGQEVVDDLDVISDELDRTLELNDYDDDDDDDDDDDTWEDDDDSESDDADEDTSEPPSDDSTTADTDDSGAAEIADQSEVAVNPLQKSLDALEKSNEELTEKVDSLTDVLQHIDTLIDDLSVSAKEFVSEVETL